MLLYANHLFLHVKLNNDALVLITFLVYFMKSVICGIVNYVLNYIMIVLLAILFAHRAQES